MVGGHAPLCDNGTGSSGGSTIATRTLTKRSASRTTAPTKASANLPTASQPKIITTRVSAFGKTKLTAPLRGQWIAQAIAPELHGRRAAAWMITWDKGSVVCRVSLLEALKVLHADSNSNAVDDDLGNAAPLFFARLTSWWKLRYCTWVTEAAQTAKANAAAAVQRVNAVAENKNVTNVTAGVGSSASSTTSELLAQVEAITVFVRGSRYLLQFVEGGGAAALCDCLEVTSTLSTCRPTQGQQQASVSAAVSALPAYANNSSSTTQDGFARERRAMTLLLLYIANSGRVYREMVGEVDNLLHILRALLQETDAAVANPITELLVVLGKGHPRLSAAVQTGLVRVLASALLPSSSQSSDSVKAKVEQATTQSAQRCIQRSSTAFSTSRLKESSTSEVVVLSTARAIRALQLQVEQHHFAQFATASTPTGSSGAGSGDNNNSNSRGRGSGVGATLTVSAVGMIDYVPVIGLDSTVTANSFAGVDNGLHARVSVTPAPDPLLQPFTTAEYLDTLFSLALAEHHTAYRVEGNELLNLAAKNIQLTPKILTRCLDVVDDDVYTLEGAGGEGDGELGISQLRLRRQLSCGRAAVLILISRPMTSERRDVLLQLVGQRGGHLTLLKYLRLTQHGDTAAVIDCCHALQFIARSSMELQQRRLKQGSAPPLSSHTFTAQGQSKTSEVVLLRMTEGIQAALGEAVYQLLLFQELSEEDCMAVLRSARAAVVSRAE